MDGRGNRVMDSGIQDQQQTINTTKNATGSPRFSLLMGGKGFDGKDFQYISKAAPPRRPSKIAIVDRFSGPENFIDLNGDRIPEIAHGEVIQKIIKRYLPAEAPEDTLVCIDIGDHGIKAALKEVLHRVETLKEPIDFVNFSQQTYGTTIEGLRELTGIEDLNSHTLSAHAASIRQRMFRLYWGIDPITTDLERNYCEHWDVIEGLENLTALGITVYVAAGNEGPQQVNLFSLASKVITVGAGSPAIMPFLRSDAPEAYSAVHSLVSIYEQGTFPVTEIRDSRNIPLGLNITGGQTIDIPLESVYNPEIRQELKRYRLPETYHSPPRGYTLWGTSFAVPRFLGQIYAKQLRTNRLQQNAKQAGAAL